VERKLRYGQRELTWEVVGANHLGDCEKLVLVFLEHEQNRPQEAAAKLTA
jgi:hypothetical protein